MCLLEVVGVGGCVHIDVDLIHPRQGVQDLQVILGALQGLGGEYVFGGDVLVFGLVEALFLHPGHVENIQLRDDLLELLMHAVFDAALLELFTDVVRHCQHLGRNEVEAGTKQAQRLGERVHGAAIFQVADERHLEAIESALGFIQGEEIQQGLCWVLVGTIPGVDHRNPRELRRQSGGPFLRMADDEGIGVGGDDADRVGQGFSLLGQRGIARVGKADHRAPQALRRRFERQPSTSGSLEETAGDQLVTEQVVAWLGLELAGGLHYQFQLGARQIGDGDDVLLE